MVEPSFVIKPGTYNEVFPSVISVPESKVDL